MRMRFQHADPERSAVSRALRQGLGLLAVLVVLTAACGGSDVDLTTQTWMLVEAGGTPAVPEAIATATFSADGALGGNTGCNGFNTSYEVDGSSLTVSPAIAATRRLCEPPLMVQEAAVFAALTGTTEFAISGSDLTLLDSAGATLARYSAEP